MEMMTHDWISRYPDSMAFSKNLVQHGAAKAKENYFSMPCMIFQAGLAQSSDIGIKTRLSFF
ncbi:MAG: hypothetical protein V4724_09330 [Pseudomonadota bacterium]